MENKTNNHFPKVENYQNLMVPLLMRGMVNYTIGKDQHFIPEGKKKNGEYYFIWYSIHKRRMARS